MPTETAYRLVRLRNGVASIHSLAEGETMHPAVGPAAEADALYARQLGLRERLVDHQGEFVVWDVGLGAAANALAVVRAAREACGTPISDSERTSFSHHAGPAPGGPARMTLRLLSFDHTVEPLRFGLQRVAELPYLAGYESLLAELLARGEMTHHDGALAVNWRVLVGDFPRWLAEVGARRQVSPPAPHAILFDPFSPAKNPAMWTAPLFANLFRLLDPQRACALATYSRSTMIRVALLLAGFFVGAGHASGQKEETTITANALSLLSAPLDRRWLERAHRSDSAEPLWEPKYRRAKLSAGTSERLRAHPQFA